MGIIDTIKTTAGNLVKGAAKIATGGQAHHPNERVNYHTDEVVSDNGTSKTIKSTDSPIPPKKKLSEKVSEFANKSQEMAKHVMGETKQAANIVGRKAGTVKGTISTKSKQAVEFIKKEAPAAWKRAEASDKTTIRQNLQAPHRAIVTAITGKAPKTKKAKKIELGRKVSKKEAKILEKHYGKNWKMAIQKKSDGSLFASSKDINMIRRENALDRTSVNFGNAFPEPNQFISSEFSRQPFQPRSADPMDIEANFMGERGSGLTSKKRDPFAIKGIKL